MIKHFKCPRTAEIYRGLVSNHFPRMIQQRAHNKLRMLHNARCLGDLFNPPSNRLEKLIGDRQGAYSLRINRKWRICFEWGNCHAYEVEICNYH